MLNIAFDLRTTHNTGVQRYGFNILQSLIPLLRSSDFRLWIICGANQEEFYHEHLKPFLSSSKIDLVFVYDDYQFVRDSVWLRNWLKMNEVQLLYSCGYIVDIKCPVKYIYTIHDLLRLKFPSYSYTDYSFLEKFGKNEFEHLKFLLQKIPEYLPKHLHISSPQGDFLRFFSSLNFYLAQHASHIITVSESVKRDIIELLFVSNDKVTVIPGAGNSKVFFRRNTLDISNTLKKFSITSSYCLYVGLNHPHKRVSYLIDIITKKFNTFPPDSKLVIVGTDVTTSSNLNSLISSRGLLDFVSVVRNISDSDLACLYSGAKALIVTSVEEGFCLPALEALMCGSEVIVPNINALKETVGDAGHFYPVNNKNILADLISDAFNGLLSSKAATFKNRFSWEASAKKLYNVFRNLIS